MITLLADVRYSKLVFTAANASVLTDMQGSKLSSKLFEEWVSYIDKLTSAD